MKKQIRTIDKERGIIQITTTDERWYTLQEDGQTRYIPSVTWICDHYPKGIAFYKWLANHGWDEAESLKNAAGEKGSRAHLAINALINGKTIKMDSVIDGEELSVEEYECVMSYAAWHKATKPRIIDTEFVVINEEQGYAGMVDILCNISSECWIVDIKTSQYIWPSHELQLSAYRHTEISRPRIAILQVGYKKNKRHWKFTEIKNKYKEFLAAKVIWANETRGVQPLQRDYPLEIKLEE